MLRIIFTAFFTISLVFSLLTSAIAAPVVLFDESHTQQFLIGNDGPLDLSGLAAVYRDNGYQVESRSAPLDKEALSEVDLLVISGPFSPLGNDELQAVINFVEKGGGLAVMLHIAPPMRDLLHRLEVDFTNGTLREESSAIDGNPLDFKVSDLTDHPLMAGLDDFSVYGSWALRGTAGHVIVVAQTSQHGWVDLDHDNKLSKADAMQPFGVVVAGQLGQGRYVVFGDDALFQNRFLDGPNQRLALNLADWLSSE